MVERLAHHRALRDDKLFSELRRKVAALDWSDSSGNSRIKVEVVAAKTDALIRVEQDRCQASYLSKCTRHAAVSPQARVCFPMCY